MTQWAIAADALGRKLTRDPFLPQASQQAEIMFAMLGTEQPCRLANVLAAVENEAKRRSLAGRIEGD